MKNFKKILFCLLLLINVFIKAQTPNWAWAKSARGNDEDEGYSVAVDKYGNSYVTGSFQSDSISFGTTTLVNTSKNSLDIFIIKYDSLGNVIWAKSAQGKADDESSSIDVDRNGNIYITGYFNSSISFGTTTLKNESSDTNLHSMFVVKYSPNGNVLWAKSADGTSNMIDNDPYQISIDSAGNIFVTGIVFTDSITFGSIKLATPDSSVFIVKYALSGDELWAKAASGKDMVLTRGLDLDNKGNAYITGYFVNSIAFDSTILIGKDDIFIAKYNSNGDLAWAQSAGGNDLDVGLDIKLDKNENVIVTGYYGSASIKFDTINLSSHFNDDAMFIAKYNSNGNVLWVKNAGGEGRAVGVCLTSDENANIFVAGYFEDDSVYFGSIGIANKNDADIFIVQYNTDGEIMWAKPVGGNDEEHPKGINIDKNGNIFLTGYFYSSSLAFGTTTLHNTDSQEGSDDIFIAKLDISITTGFTNYSINNEINISPNPSKGKIQVHNLSADKYEIKIYNLLGDCIYQGSNESQEIDLSNQSQGVYFYSIQNRKGIKTGKIIIE